MSNAEINHEYEKQRKTLWETAQDERKDIAIRELTDERDRLINVKDDILAVVAGTEKLANALTWKEEDLDLPGARNFYEANELLKERCARIKQALAEKVI